jgi:dTDP-4-dehydrorhamnose 3,5-epimerase
MEILELDIPGVLLLKPKVISDERGSFLESYKESLFHDAGIDHTFCQDNQSVSRRNVIRGLHFQEPPFEQGKLVRVVTGSVMDVVVDIRKGSPHYGHYLKVQLNALNMNVLWIPPGFAHGFVSLEDDTMLLYKCTKEYNRESESGILWNDPDLAIDWGIEDPVISEKDKALPCLKDLNSKF